MCGRGDVNSLTIHAPATKQARNFDKVADGVAALVDDVGLTALGVLMPGLGIGGAGLQGVEVVRQDGLDASHQFGDERIGRALRPVVG